MLTYTQTPIHPCRPYDMQIMRVNTVVRTAFLPKHIFEKQLVAANNAWRRSGGVYNPCSTSVMYCTSCASMKSVAITSVATQSSRDKQLSMHVLPITKNKRARQLFSGKCCSYTNHGSVRVVIDDAHDKLYCNNAYPLPLHLADFCTGVDVFQETATMAAAMTNEFQRSNRVYAMEIAMTKLCCATQAITNLDIAGKLISIKSKLYLLCEKCARLMLYGGYGRCVCSLCAEEPSSDTLSTCYVCNRKCRGDETATIIEFGCLRGQMLSLKGVCDKCSTLVTHVRKHHKLSKLLQENSDLCYKTMVACTKKKWLGVMKEAAMQNELAKIQRTTGVKRSRH